MKRITLIVIAISACLIVTAKIINAQSCVTYEQNGDEYYNLNCGVFTCSITKKLWWNIYWRNPSGEVTTVSTRFETRGTGYKNIKTCNPLFHTPVITEFAGAGTWEQRVISQTEKQEGGAAFCVWTEDRYFSESANCSSGGGETCGSTPGWDGSCPDPRYPNNGMCCEGGCNGAAAAPGCTSIQAATGIA